MFKWNMSPQPPLENESGVNTPKGFWNPRVQLWLLWVQLLPPTTHNWRRTIPPSLVLERSRLSGPQTLCPLGLDTWSWTMRIDWRDKTTSWRGPWCDVTAPLGGLIEWPRVGCEVGAKWFPHFYLWSRNNDKRLTWNISDQKLRSIGPGPSFLGG